MKQLRIFASAVLALFLLGATCARPNDTPQERIAALRGFGSADEFKAYLVDQAQASYQRSGGLFGFSLLGLVPEANVATDAAAPSAGAASDNASAGTGDPFSTTNIQEAGVDESDVVKNDDQYIYVLSGNTIHIVQANPPTGLAEASKIDIEANGDSLYLSGDRLVALSRRAIYHFHDMGFVFPAPASQADVALSNQGPSSDGGVESLVGGPLNDGVQTTVTVINIADPAAPVIEATLRFEGNLAGSRLIGNLLHLVLTTIPRLPDDPTLTTLEAMPLEDWIPDYELIAADGSTRSGDIADWQSFFRPENPDGYGMTIVVTLDIQSPTTPFKSTGISADAGVIYVSPAALYVTNTKYDYQSGVSRSDTVIHKLAFTADGTAYGGSGLVPGRLLNQYSLGEFEGWLRVATTVTEFGANSSRQDNSVYILEQSPGSDEVAPSLVTVGKIEGIAPGEQLYSARFVGNRGFLVTFQRVDPLFTLDLSDPANPRVVGELKVPGYSDHIQLLDENHLLTIGKDAQDAGSFAWIQGLQLSIFDVTDPADPVLLHKELIGGRGTSSEANYNPKALNYFASANALAFPADVYTSAGGGASWGNHEFTGLYVYRVTVEDGFQFLGRIASDEDLSPSGCFYRYNGLTRGVFIGNTVYCVTERDVKAASLDAVDAIIGQATLSKPPELIEDCFLMPQIVLPGGAGLR